MDDELAGPNGMPQEFWNRVTRPESRRFVPYEVDEKHGFARMHQNESPLPDTIRNDFICGALESLSSSWFSELNPKGPQQYPELSSMTLRESYGVYLGIPPENLQVFAGSSEALYTIASGCFSPQTRVAFLEPSFSLLKELVDLWGANHVPIRLDDDRQVQRQILFSKEVLESEVVILCNPNNPTGQPIPTDWVREFVEEAQGLVVVDEAYFEFFQARNQNEKSFANLALEKKNLVVLRTMSKAWGAAGLRVGALIGNTHWVKFFSGLRRPYSIPSPTEVMASWVLRHKQEAMQHIVHEALKGCDELRQGLLALQLPPSVCRVFESQTNFVYFNVHSDMAVKLSEKCLAEQILIRNLGSGAMRVSPWTANAHQTFLKVAAEVLVVE